MSCSFPCPKKGRIKAPPVVPLMRKNYRKSRLLFAVILSSREGLVVRRDGCHQIRSGLPQTPSYPPPSSSLLAPTSARWLVSLKPLPWNVFLRNPEDKAADRGMSACMAKRMSNPPIVFSIFDKNSVIEYGQGNW